MERAKESEMYCSSMRFEIYPYCRVSQTFSQDEIAKIRKRKRGRNMLNRSGNTKDNLCFRYRFRDVFSRFRCCVYNGTGPLLRKHNGNMELHVSATFQKYGNMWFRPVNLLVPIWTPGGMNGLNYLQAAQVFSVSWDLRPRCVFSWTMKHFVFIT